MPGETEEGLGELVRLSLELGAVHPVAIGMAPFVAKLNTPMLNDSGARRRNAATGADGGGGAGLAALGGEMKR